MQPVAVQCSNQLGSLCYLSSFRCTISSTETFPNEWTTRIPALWTIFISSQHLGQLILYHTFPQFYIFFISGLESPQKNVFSQFTYYITNSSLLILSGSPIQSQQSVKSYARNEWKIKFSSQFPWGKLEYKDKLIWKLNTI